MRNNHNNTHNPSNSKITRTNGLNSVLQFYKMKGHCKTDCYKFKAMMNNKNTHEGIPLGHVCFESLLVDVSLNSWWIDNRTSINVTTWLQGFVKKLGRN